MRPAGLLLFTAPLDFAELVGAGADVAHAGDVHRGVGIALLNLIDNGALRGGRDDRALAVFVLGAKATVSMKILSLDMTKSPYGLT